MSEFSPIAIVGMGAVLPGCLNYMAVWDTVLNGKIQLSTLSKSRQKNFDYLLHNKPGEYIPDKTWNLNGGYVTDFRKIFNPTKFNVESELLLQLDVVCQWSLQAASEALGCVQITKPKILDKTGIILGNLFLPTQTFAEYTFPFYLDGLLSQKISTKNQEPLNRFMSGYPAELIAKALNLKGIAYAIDAACASGIYAIKLACDELHSGKADLMIAGGVNAVDFAFMQVAFSTINALSLSGQSRPFCQDADGLLPAEGAACLALKRLEDVDDCERIFGIIRGVGLTNSGKSGGFLSPSISGEVDCITQAYKNSLIDPSDINYVECHATGTESGDRAEILTLKEVFYKKNIVLSSLKANMGHLLTAAGIASVIKVLGCFHNRYLPKALNANPLNNELIDSRLHILENNQPWNGRMVAGINAFGFGGNNGHLIIEGKFNKTNEKSYKFISTEQVKVAVVGVGLKSSFATDVSEFSKKLFNDDNLACISSSVSEALIKVDGTSPPKDLLKAIGQQLLLLSALDNALQNVHSLENSKIGIYVGMSTDPEICRYYFRIKAQEILSNLNLKYSDDDIEIIKTAIAPPLDASISIGMMPQLVANRISASLNSSGPSFAVAAEELSGDMALRIAIFALIKNEINSAIVGAVDLSSELINESVVRRIDELKNRKLSDSSVILILKRLDDAINDKDQILAILNNNSEKTHVRQLDFNDLGEKVGYPLAAYGLLNILSAILMLNLKTYRNISSKKLELINFGNNTIRNIKVINSNFLGTQLETTCSAGLPSSLLPSIANDYEIYFYSADSVENLLRIVEKNTISFEGVYKLSFVCRKKFSEIKRKEAINLLRKKSPDEPHWFINGIAFSSKNITGKLAFVFNGSASAYAGFLREIVFNCPVLLDNCLDKSVISDSIPSFVMNNQVNSLLPLEQAIATSTLSQIHSEFTLNILGLKPNAAIGVSQGEIDALFAFGVWRDCKKLLNDIDAAKLYGNFLSGELSLVKQHWGLKSSEEIRWKSYFISASVSKIKRLILNVERLYILIIYTNSQCVIGGDSNACQQILNKLENIESFVELDFNFAVHCPVANLYLPELRTLYTRDIFSLSEIEFYSNYFNDTYELTNENIMEAIVGQLGSCIDFPTTVRKSWNDGVRVFLSHGPKSSLSSAINDILSDMDHVVISLDSENQNSYEHMLFAASSLWCLGVNIDLTKLTLPKFDERRKFTINAKLRLPLIKNIIEEVKSNFLEKNDHIDSRIVNFSKLYGDIYEINDNYLKCQKSAFSEYNDCIVKIINQINK